MNNGTENKSHVAVIGAGIIGVCSALFLRRDGYEVTLIDRQGPGEGASFGNGSVIGEDQVLPVATPGILGRVPKMLFDPLGPLAVRWGYLPNIAPWLLRFVRASSPARVERISIALDALLDGAIDAYMPLLDMAGARDMIRRSGWVGPYETEAGFRRFEPMLAVLRRRGVNFEVLTAEELRQLEPNLAPIFARGIFYPDVSYSVNNFRMVQVLAEAFQRAGGRWQEAEVTGFEIGPEGPRALRTAAGSLPVDRVVVAAGAWSKKLTAQLGSRPPLETERGYHLTIPEPGVMPRMPVYSTERGIVTTPLETGLRVAGTVELGGLDADPNWARAEVLRHHAKRWYPGLNDAGASRWMGFRPSMPDSLPVIGHCPRFGNVVFAFGHGHCGLAMGAATGWLVADLTAGREPAIDMSPYRADRF
jgi:D-amino-acid dehydrogenase